MDPLAYSRKYTRTQYKDMQDEDVYLLFTEDKWRKLTMQKRLEALQEIECRMAARQRRIPCKVVGKKMQPGCQGVFNGQELVINFSLLQSAPASRFGLRAECKPIIALDTVLHEGRHAFQRAAVIGCANRRSVSDETLQSWLMNQIRYAGTTEKPSDFFIYAFQPIERDAREFAGRTIAGIYQRIMNITGKRDGNFEQGLARIRKEKMDEYRYASLILKTEDIDARSVQVREEICAMLACRDEIQIPYMDTTVTLRESMVRCGIDDEGMMQAMDGQTKDIRGIVQGEREKYDFMDGLDEPGLLMQQLDADVEMRVTEDLDSIVARIREKLDTTDIAGRIQTKPDGFRAGF